MICKWLFLQEKVAVEHNTTRLISKHPRELFAEDRKNAFL
jgi:hypothetical protein